MGDRKLSKQSLIVQRRSLISCQGFQLCHAGIGERLEGINQKSAEVKTVWESSGGGEEGSGESVAMAMGGGGRCLRRCGEGDR